jgi:Na+/H+ antiporter NhaC
MEDLGIFSVLIPLGIIVMAIITKDVVVSLLFGIFFGQFILHDFDPFVAMIELLEEIIKLFSEGWIVKTLLFALLVGAIIKLIARAGGVTAFVSHLHRKQQSIDSPMGAQFLAYVIGILIFIESSITVLIAGAVAKPLCDKNGVSREKLAFICDSTSAPVCSLIPFNAWGALLLGLIVAAINENVITGDGITLLLESILYNFYSLIVLVIVFLSIYFRINIGPMKEAKAVPYVEENISQENKHPSIWIMLLPIIVLIALVPLSLYYTGKGDILKGSGSTSIFYATIGTLMFMYVYYLMKGHITHKKFFSGFYEGIAEMIPIVFILLLAFAIGAVIKELGTANYISTLFEASELPIFLLPLLIFLVSALTAFSTGTSWGTFSIMMPIALGLAGAFDMNIPLMIGAVVSGGIFGDHVSPISDTTIISSMATGCDHIEHVRTQMPYALIGAFLASILFLIFGYIH